MDLISINTGQFEFKARFEYEKAPATCSRMLEMLPFRNKVIHSRWSGEAVWMPMGEFDSNLEFENHTCHPSRGDVLFYPGGYSETEILLVYGSSIFASKMGVLAGNHFMTIIKGNEDLEAFGKQVLWEGAQDITISLT